MLWRFRNEVVFTDKPPLRDVIFDNITEYFFCGLLVDIKRQKLSGVISSRIPFCLIFVIVFASILLVFWINLVVKKNFKMNWLYELVSELGIIFVVNSQPNGNPNCFNSSVYDFIFSSCILTLVPSCNLHCIMALPVSNRSYMGCSYNISLS